VAKRRVSELKKAAGVLGISKVEYLDYIDGTLSNRDLNSGRLQRQIEKKIRDFRPQVVLTFDRSGISGHIDHIVLSYATTIAVKNVVMSFMTSEIRGAINRTTTKNEVDCLERLYCSTISVELAEKIQKVNPSFPNPLVEKGAKVVRYDISDSWKAKKRAIRAHKTQKGDWEKLIPIWESLPKFEYYKLVVERKPEVVKGAPFF
jgi:LmbE family N-acetylglucosaminyl deacetylase